MRTSLATFAVITLCAACSAPAPQPGSNTAVSDAAAHQAHEAYVTAIRSSACSLTTWCFYPRMSPSW